MLQKKITLTAEQEKFVRENYATLSPQQLGERLRVSPKKISKNLVFMGLNRFEPQQIAPTRRKVVVEAGFFDVNYKNCFI